jgi:hypothetical protein
VILLTAVIGSLPMDPISLIALLVAIAAALFAFWQSVLTRRSLGAETLLHLDDTWRSERVLKTRSLAAAQLLQVRRGKPIREVYESDQSDVDEVLDYLETVAFFCRRKVLDIELVWNMFYWPMANYWNACVEYVKLVRGAEGRHTWDNLAWLLPKLNKLHPEENPPNEANLPNFLATEAALCGTKTS